VSRATRTTRSCARWPCPPSTAPPIRRGTPAAAPPGRPSSFINSRSRRRSSPIGTPPFPGCHRKAHLPHRHLGAGGDRRSAPSIATRPRRRIPGGSSSAPATWSSRGWKRTSLPGRGFRATLARGRPAGGNSGRTLGVAYHKYDNVPGRQDGKRTHPEGPAESPQEGGAPLPDELHSLGYPHRRKNGGRSEVKRSRAGSPHGEPRTEPPLRGGAAEGGVPEAAF